MPFLAGCRDNTHYVQLLVTGTKKDTPMRYQGLIHKKKASKCGNARS